MGIATFVLDGLAGRGITSVSADHGGIIPPSGSSSTRAPSTQTKPETACDDRLTAALTEELQLRTALRGRHLRPMDFTGDHSRDSSAAGGRHGGLTGVEASCIVYALSS
jgi:hypothetical protein